MAKPRNILVLQSSSDLYGTGKIILQVLRLYQREGINAVVLLTGPGPLEPILRAEGFTVYIQNLGILRRKYVSPAGLVNRFGKNFQAFRFLTELHNKYEFELVYSNTLAVIVGAYWAKKNKVPHQWHIHEIFPGPRPLVKFVCSLMDKTTPSPIAVSRAVANHWQPLLKKSRIEVIHNGIPYDEFLEALPNAKAKVGLPQEQLIVGMVGRVNPHKGQSFFLEMAEQIARKYSNVHFILVGDPFSGYEPILEELKQKIVDKKLGDRVSYLGYRTDVPDLMRAMDIFVLPSTFQDPFPTVVLEAMASALPVVATDSGGSVEMVVDGETGFLIPVGNVDIAAEALEKLIKNPELRSEFGMAGRKRVLSEYSLEAFEEKMKSIYGKI
ncbi:glycosyltransferase family 4 protein [Algoriphagus aestuariicola]|uniref:Glycosyltransferase family 4 protein n=1 Tax=Algoriphagus aestuariicola TaxID=1852016 RepID=A0ABS3BT69_9BACT|nr:glycosyltransferase family 4 protein [Algoriphagus aestuariicola]MBN7802479.1 glycosyltransferase family 4 protein [Algoriphagus aestuariicola]